jgi:hypothetical protein
MTPKATAAQALPVRRLTGALLVGGLALAVATPAYVAFAAPSLAGYLLHPPLLLLQAVPHVLCGALWLPRRAPAPARAGFVVSTLLLVATLIAYVPMIVTAGRHGGDMIALAYVAVSGALTVGVLASTAVALIVLRAAPFWRR